MKEDNNTSDKKSEENRGLVKATERGTDDQSALPLYLRNKSEGHRGNAQDEKDESAE
ncbi:MAG TPA: hypothetical protein VF543_00060 [Pyrinomonadaceae bacterium]|jgi:hypothetical protein